MKQPKRFDQKPESAFELGKMPPQAIEIEEVVIGAIMIETDAYLLISDILTADDFYREPHRLVFEAITQLHSKNERIDMLTVSEMLRKNGTMEDVGGPFFITQLVSRVGGAGHIEDHARIIKDKSLQRKMIAFANELGRLSYDNIDLAIEHSRNELFKIFEIINKKSTSKWIEVLNASLKRIYENVVTKKNGKQTGVPTGLRELDEFTGGWQNSNLIILAGRPGMGKTSLMISFLKQALMCKVNCLVFSLEMSEDQICQKIIGTNGISPRKMRSGDLNDEELNNIEDFAGSIENWPLKINDDAGLTISQIETITEREKIKFDIHFIMIDYLQLIENPIGQTENERYSNTSRRLKQLAKRCNIPVMALSQLNRSSDGKVPKLSELRGSGAIEQDADDVLFIHRNWYYDQSNPEEEFTGDLIFAKHRMGGTGNIKFRHNNIFTKFSDFSDQMTIDNSKPF